MFPNKFHHFLKVYCYEHFQKFWSKLLHNILMMKVFSILLLFPFYLFGQNIFVVDKDYKSDLKIYVVDKLYQADLSVFLVNKNYKAKKNRGLWFKVDKEYKAEKKIFYVDKEYKSDIKVFFVDKSYKSGWRNESKKYFFEL